MRYDIFASLPRCGEIWIVNWQPFLEIEEAACPMRISQNWLGCRTQPCTESNVENIGLH